MAPIDKARKHLSAHLGPGEEIVAARQALEPGTMRSAVGITGGAAGGLVGATVLRAATGGRRELPEQLDPKQRIDLAGNYGVIALTPRRVLIMTAKGELIHEFELASLRVVSDERGKLSGRVRFVQLILPDDRWLPFELQAGFWMRKRVDEFMSTFERLLATV